MTTNFGCCERRIMASQPSQYNEERNLLRLRAWEQRNQETSQAKEQENVPLFGEPYKTNKGDELSNLIQRMLGSYEDVNNPNPTVTEPLRIPTYAAFSQLDQGQKSLDSQARPPFHNQAISCQSQKAPTSNGCPPQPSRTSGPASSPDRRGSSSTFSNVSLNHSQLSRMVHCHQKSEAHLRERTGLAQEVCSQSPTKSLSLQCPRDLANTCTNKDTCDRLPRLSSSECPGSGDVSTPIPRDPTKDAPLPQTNKGNTLPSQTFPSLLCKQPSVVMTQKPTAYVRPMDGQDQVVNESPELKPSPQPYVPLPELINKSHLDKEKKLPPYLEIRPNEAHCVEDILREMTCFWPPILTAVNSPNTGEPSKSPFQPKGAEHVSSHPGQTVIPEKCDTSPADSSQHLQIPTQQSSSCSVKAAHSRGLESPSSSDSESSSRSDSDGESAIEEPPQCPGSSSMKAECSSPAAKHVDWQLGNWIPSSKQNSHAEGHCDTRGSDSPRPPQSVTEVVEPSWESKPQQEFTKSAGKPHTYSERHQDHYKQPDNPPAPPSSSGVTSCSHKHSCPTNTSTSAKAGSIQPPACVKCEKVGAVLDKDPCFTVRPKVKTKMGPSRKNKDRCETKKDNKRTSKHASHDKLKAGSESEVALVLYGHCPSCGVQYPNSCPCPTHSPPQPDQLSPAPPIRISCSKSNSDVVWQKGTKVPPKTTQKHLEKTPQSSRNSHRFPRSLLVKIDLSLLSKVPQISRNHRESLSKTKRSSAVKQHDGKSSEASTAQKLGKSSEKSNNVKVDNKVVPRKKPRLENKNTSSSHASVKLETIRSSAEDREIKKAKKTPVPQQQHPTAKEASKDKRASAGFPKTNKESCKHKAKDSRKHKRSSGKRTEPLPPSDKTTKSSISAEPSGKALTQRPLLRPEDRQYPVKHYIKEAKKLKHKADAESDKLCKAFSYVDAAMYFVESGIAMEKDPQISMSSYTMFAETVELLKFVLKLKNSVDASAPSSEKDFIVLCLKCQSLLHMAMFRHKQRTAIKYSKTLTDHFSNAPQRTQSPLVMTPNIRGTPSPMPSLPSPAPTSSGSSSNHSVDAINAFVSVPQVIEQVAFSYVNITSLFLRAHEIWEKAEELARKGSGLLTELDTVLGPLNLMSSMTFMVRYTRQGVDWLRLDCRKGN
eukprot:XP_011602904.1 PREDICTED: AF4/FMR2 family member 1 isoform X2 [Takifugu rubripes]